MDVLIRLTFSVARWRTKPFGLADLQDPIESVCRKAALEPTHEAFLPINKRHRDGKCKEQFQ